MSKMNTLNGIYTFYRDGFRHMTPLGRTLWLIIAIKLLIIFAVLRIFFFQPALQGSDEEKSQQVRQQLIDKMQLSHTH